MLREMAVAQLVTKVEIPTKDLQVIEREIINISNFKNKINQRSNELVIDF